MLGKVPFDPKTEVFVKALKGEAILTQKQLQTGADIFNNLMSRNFSIDKNDIPSSVDNSQHNSLVIQNMEVQANDAHDFINQMRSLVSITGNQL